MSIKYTADCYGRDPFRVRIRFDFGKKLVENAVNSPALFPIIGAANAVNYLAVARQSVVGSVIMIE